PRGAASESELGGFISMGVNPLASLQAVDGAAVRTLAFAGGDDVDEDLRMVAPQRHLRVGAEHDAVAHQIVGRDFDAVARFAHVVQTLVSHSAYFGLRPFTMSK